MVGSREVPSDSEECTLAPARKCRCRDHHVSKIILVIGGSRYVPTNTGLLDHQS